MKNRVLLVEDDFIIRMYLASVLSRLGCEIVSEASTCDEAIQGIIDTNPELVLMDIGIKGDRDGIETTKIINERFKLPVIYLTGNSDPVTLKKAENTNPIGFIFKPIDEQSLVNQFQRYREGLGK